MNKAEHFKSGFVAVVGRPNVGKSTMINALIGDKIAIVSDKAQTTRNRIICVYTDEEKQIVFMDTPGVHKPKHKLGEFMVDAAIESLKETEAVLFVVAGNEKRGPGDNFIIEQLKRVKVPVFLVVNKIDTLQKEQVLEAIVSYQDAYPFAGVIPISAKNKENLSMSDEVYPLIYENSSGSMRDSISILERLIVTANGNEINLKIAEETLGVTPSSRIKIFLDKLLNESEYNIINELEALANESFDIELFFKDLAKYCKNAIVKNELDIDKGLKIISTIYDVINKFKFEDDKKLVGYVIVADILANSTQTIVRTVTKVQKVVEDTDNTPNTVVEAVKEKPKVQVTIADVKSNWNSILDEAKKKRISYKVFLMGANPVRVEDNIIFITYDKKYLFPKEQMESEEYNREFTEIIRKFFNENSLELKYEVIGQKKEEESGEEEFFKKIENYFKGNS